MTRLTYLALAVFVFLLSLLGLPPLAGFMAKFQILSALFDGAQNFQNANKPMLSNFLYVVVAFGGLNTVLSLFYYVRVLKVMILEKTLEEVEGRPIAKIDIPWIHAGFVSALAVVVIALGIVWNPLAVATADKGVDAFLRVPASHVEIARH